MQDADPRSADSSAAPARDPAAASTQPEAAQAIPGGLASQAAESSGAQGAAAQRGAGQQRSRAGWHAVPGQLTPQPAAAGPGAAAEIASAEAASGAPVVPASAADLAAHGGNLPAADLHGGVSGGEGDGAASGPGAEREDEEGERAGFRGRLETLLQSAGGFNRPPPAAAATAIGSSPDPDPIARHGLPGEQAPARQAQAEQEPGVAPRGRAQESAGPSALGGVYASGLATPAMPAHSAWPALAADTPLLAAATGRKLPEWLTPAPLGRPPGWLATGVATGLRGVASAGTQPPEWLTPAPPGDPPGWLAGAGDSEAGVTRALPPARALTPFRSLVAEIEAHLAAARAPPTPAPDHSPEPDPGRLWWTNELAVAAAAEPNLAAGETVGAKPGAPATADAATCTSPQGVGLGHTPAPSSGEHPGASRAQEPASEERESLAQGITAGEGPARRLFAAVTPGQQPAGADQVGSELGSPGPAPLRSPLAELRPPGAIARVQSPLARSSLAGGPAGKAQKHRKVGAGSARREAAQERAGLRVKWAAPEEDVQAGADLPARLAYLDLATARGAGAPGWGSGALDAPQAPPMRGSRPAAGRVAGGAGPHPVSKLSSSPMSKWAHAAAPEPPRRARHVRSGSARPWVARKGMGQGEDMPPWQGSPRTAGKPKRKRVPPGDEADAPGRPAQRTALLALGAPVVMAAADLAPLEAAAACAAKLGREVAGATAALEQLSAAEEQVQAVYRLLTARHVAAAAAASEAAARAAGAGTLALAADQEASSSALSAALEAAHEALDDRDRDAAVLRAEAEGLADVLGAAGADAAAEAAARAQLDAQLAQAQRRLAQVTRELATCRTDLAACRAELARTRLLLSAARAAAAAVQNPNPADVAAGPASASVPAAPGLPTHSMGGHAEPGPDAAKSAHGSCSAAERMAWEGAHMNTASDQATGAGQSAGAPGVVPATGSLSGSGAVALAALLPVERGGEDLGPLLDPDALGDGAGAAGSAGTPALRNLAQALALAAAAPDSVTPGNAGAASGGDGTAAVGPAAAPTASAGQPSTAAAATGIASGAAHASSSPVASGVHQTDSVAASAAPPPRPAGFPGSLPARAMNPGRTPRALRPRSAWDSPLPAAPATGASTAALARALSGIRERERTAERTPPAPAPPAGPSPLATALSRLGRPGPGSGSGSGSLIGFSTPASAASAGAGALSASTAQAAGAAGLGVYVAPTQTPLAAVLAQLLARTPAG